MKKNLKKSLKILIDGADGVGKTTICKLLSEKLKIPIVKMPNMHEYFENNNPEEFSKLFNETIVQFPDSSYILDRGYPSSIVYSKVYKRDFDLSYLDEIREKLQAKVIILTADWPTVQKRKDKDEIIQTNERIKLVMEYQIYGQYKDDITLIDTSNKNPEEICKEITESL